MLTHRPESRFVRLSLVIAILCLLALSAVGCGGSTDSELKSAVQQLDQDLQQSVEQLNQGISDSLTELNTAVSSAAQGASTGASNWEYDLGVVAYDLECATKAIEPYKSKSAVKETLSMGVGRGRYLIGWLYMDYSCIGSLSATDWYAISDAYVQCGQDAFQLYSTGMGDEGWEMVSYSRLQYTSPSTQYCSGLIVDYGYEVMWKRPKTTE